MKNLGIAYMPGTFPTGEVLNAIQQGLPITAKDWTRSKVNELYYLYKEAIEAGQKPYGPGQPGALDWMVKNSNYDVKDIRVFLFVLYQLASEGKISIKWWDIEKQATRTTIPIIPKVSKTIDKYTSVIKWVSIAGIVGIAVFYGWPVFNKIRKGLK